MTSTGTRDVRAMWIVFLGGPVVWALHFMIVYFIAEVACRFPVLDFRLLGLPGVSFFTVALTVVAGVGTLVLAGAAYRRWRAGDARQTDFTGMLLSILSFVAILFVGVPAFFLQPC